MRGWVRRGEGRGCGWSGPRAAEAAHRSKSPPRPAPGALAHRCFEVLPRQSRSLRSQQRAWLHPEEERSLRCRSTAPNARHRSEGSCRDSWQVLQIQSAGHGSREQCGSHAKAPGIRHGTHPPAHIHEGPFPRADSSHSPPNRVARSPRSQGLELDLGTSHLPFGIPPRTLSAPGGAVKTRPAPRKLKQGARHYLRSNKSLRGNTYWPNSSLVLTSVPDKMAVGGPKWQEEFRAAIARRSPSRHGPPLTCAPPES